MQKHVQNPLLYKSLPSEQSSSAAVTDPPNIYRNSVDSCRAHSAGCGGQLLQANYVAASFCTQIRFNLAQAASTSCLPEDDNKANNEGEDVVRIWVSPISV